MSFWKRKNQSSDSAFSAGDAGKVQKAKRTIKRSPPLAMEVKILALEALDSGLSAIEVGELVGVGSGTCVADVHQLVSMPFRLFLAALGAEAQVHN